MQQEDKEKAKAKKRREAKKEKEEKVRAKEAEKNKLAVEKYCDAVVAKLSPSFVAMEVLNNDRRMCQVPPSFKQPFMSSSRSFRAISRRPRMHARRPRRTS